MEGFVVGAVVMDRSGVEAGGEELVVEVIAGESCVGVCADESVGGVECGFRLGFAGAKGGGEDVFKGLGGGVFVFAGD